MARGLVRQLCKARGEMGAPRATLCAVLAANFSDPEHARIIYLAAGGLVLMAIALVGGTVWWWRSSAVEHPALGPLEMMSTKVFRSSDEEMRREIIEAARPGAQVVDEPEVHDELLEQLDGDPSSELSFAGVMPADNDAVEFADVDVDVDVDVAVDVVVAVAEAPVPEPRAPVAPRPALFDQHADEDDSAHDWRPAPVVIRTEPQPPVAPRPIDPLLKNDNLW